MADNIGTVRVELVADPSGVQRGIEQASSALTRIGTVAATVGNLLADALAGIADRVTGLLSDMLAGQGDVFDQLTVRGRNALGVLRDNFQRLNEAQTAFTAEVADRALPALARLADIIGRLAGEMGGAKLATDTLVGAIKTLAIVGAAVAAVFDLAGTAIAGAIAAAILAGRGEFQAALEALKSMGQDITATFQRYTSEIQRMWSETTTRIGTPPPATEEFGRHMRRLAAEAQRVFEQTRTPFEQLQVQLDKLNVLLQHGLISWDTYQRAVQMAQDRISGARDAMRQVGQAMETAFVDAVTGAKSLGDALRGLLKDLARIAAQSVFRQLFGSMFGFVGRGGSSGFGAALPGFATGGSFVVPGAGGIDSQVAAMRLTPGERVTVTKPGQHAGGVAVVQPRVVVNNYSDAEVTAGRGPDDDLEITVRGIVRDEFGSGRMNPLMMSKHGIKPRVRAR